MSSVIDLKTGSPEPWHELQVAAYQHGVPSSHISLEPQTHIYTIEQSGDRVPGVTQILDEMGEISEFAKKSERARERGLMVHIAGSLLPDRLDWSTVDPQIMGYVVSLAEWFRQTKCEVQAQEQRIYIPELGVAGTLDLRASFAIAPRNQNGSLYLQKDGSLAKFKPIHRSSWAVFVSIVNHWKWRNQNGRAQRGGS
jgi:hypothetical protein